MDASQAGEDEDLEHQNRHDGAESPHDLTTQATSGTSMGVTP